MNSVPTPTQIRRELERLGYSIDHYGRRWWVRSGRVRVMLATPGQAWAWLVKSGQVEEVA